MKRERRNCSDQRDLTLSVALRVAVKTYLSDRNLSEVYLSVTARRAAKLRFPRLSSTPPRRPEGTRLLDILKIPSLPSHCDSAAVDAGAPN